VKLIGVILVLQNLKELRRGESIEQHLSYLERPLVTGTRTKHAPFEYSALLAAEIEIRLKKCGIDGFMLKVHIALDESKESIAKALGVPYEEVERGIWTAAAYVSGKWPKAESYNQYRKRKTYLLGMVKYGEKSCQ